MLRSVAVTSNPVEHIACAKIAHRDVKHSEFYIYTDRGCSFLSLSGVQILKHTRSHLETGKKTCHKIFVINFLRFCSVLQTRISTDLQIDSELISHPDIK